MASLLLMPSLLPSRVTLSGHYSGWTEQLPEFYIIRWVEGEVGIEKDAFSRVGDFHEIPASIALCRAAMV